MTTLEKAARAIGEFIDTPLPNATIPPTTIDLSGVSAGSLGDIRKELVRVVLLAIRDPDEETISAALKASGSSPDMEIDMKIDWQAMIDAILKEGPK